MTTRYDGGLNRYVYSDSAVPIRLSVRTRITLAQLNAGITLLPALPGFSYRLFDISMLAVGGAGAGGTSANVIGTRAASAVQLGVAAVARLVQSVYLRCGTPFATAGAESITTLADGASWAALDVNTPITCITVGSAMTTLTNLDVTLDFTIDG